MRIQIDKINISKLLLVNIFTMLILLFMLLNNYKEMFTFKLLIISILISCTYIYVLYQQKKCFIAWMDDIRFMYWKYIDEVLRRERHDYMNNLQIIYGYLQLNKQEKALEKIKTITTISQNISKLFHLKCVLLSIFLSNKIKEAFSHGLILQTNVISDATKEDYLDILDVQEILLPLDTFFSNIIKVFGMQQGNEVYIEIYENKDELKFQVYTDEWIEDLPKKLAKNIIYDFVQIQDNMFTIDLYKFRQFYTKSKKEKIVCMMREIKETKY